MLPRRSLLLSLLACSSVFAAHWDSVYFYDHATEVLEFADIASPTQLRSVAVGTIRDTLREKTRHVAIVTADGGEHWQEVKLEDRPVSLFFLNDTSGWMVTENGVWKTDEAGRSWTRLSRQRNQSIVSVWFLDANHGFGVGARKSVVETKDGGRTWKKVSIAKDTVGDPKLSVYTDLLFVNPQTGLIVGADLRALSPLATASRATIPMLQLKTNDGGFTWLPEPGPRGAIANRIKFSGEEVLVLMLFTDRRGKQVTSLFRIPLRKEIPASVVYEATDLKVTDFGAFSGRTYLVGVDQAKNRDLETVERKVRILESTGSGFKLWEEMEVDYAALATNLLVAGTDPDHVFVATDRGMILKLNR